MSIQVGFQEFQGFQGFENLEILECKYAVTIKNLQESSP
jgi:hypothetical protein